MSGDIGTFIYLLLDNTSMLIIDLIKYPRIEQYWYKCFSTDSKYSHSSGLVTWVRNKSCQPDLRFSEQTDVAGGTTTQCPVRGQL